MRLINSLLKSKASYSIKMRVRMKQNYLLESKYVEFQSSHSERLHEEVYCFHAF